MNSNIACRSGFCGRAVEYEPGLDEARGGMLVDVAGEDILDAEDVDDLVDVAGEDVRDAEDVGDEGIVDGFMPGAPVVIVVMSSSMSSIFAIII